MPILPGARRCLVAAALAAAVAACGQPDPVAMAPRDLPLPTVPAEDLAVGEVARSSPTTAIDEPLDGASDEVGRLDEPGLASARAGTGDDDWRLLAGFQGTRWTTSGRATVQVLADTVTVRDGVAIGLVRNERDVPVGPVMVAVGDARVEALLPVLRPGEPAPFELEVGDVEVADLDWDVTAPDAATTPAREVDLATFWQRGVEDPRPADTYLYDDADGHPMVVFGEAAAFGPVDGLQVVAAWIGSDGRVVGATTGIVATADLAPGEASDFVVAEPGPPALDAARLMLWATGS